MLLTCCFIHVLCCTRQPSIFVSRAPFENYAALVSNTYLSVGSTISAGEIQNLYAVEVPIANLEKLIKYLGIEPGEDPFEIEVVYASIYKEKWRINSTQEGHPVEL